MIPIGKNLLITRPRHYIASSYPNIVCYVHADHAVIVPIAKIAQRNTANYNFDLRMLGVTCAQACYDRCGMETQVMRTVDRVYRLPRAQFPAFILRF